MFAMNITIYQNTFLNSFIVPLPSFLSKPLESLVLVSHCLFNHVQIYRFAHNLSRTSASGCLGTVIIGSAVKVASAGRTTCLPVVGDRDEYPCGKGYSVGEWGWGFSLDEVDTLDESSESLKKQPLSWSCRNCACFLGVGNFSPQSANPLSTHLSQSSFLEL